MRDAPLAGRYQAARLGADPIASEVARRQLARLGADRRMSSPSPAGPSRWAHVPLPDLFVEQGNRLHVRPGGLVECAHEPFHGSRSGRCVLVDASRGRWWCRACRQSGDAAAYVAAVRGCAYREAAATLIERYGPPPGWRGQARPRLVLEAVIP